MADNFRITSRKKGNSLYIKLWGDFDEISATELIYTLRDKVNTAEKIYVETDYMNNLYSLGRKAFKGNFDLSPELYDKIIFVGNNARQISPR
ncbi:MAG: hypothetical protein KGY61_07830 [Desulfobacterales bacterium]|nr:hypothetical protein [Desulfobacterales bacterium]